MVIAFHSVPPQISRVLFLERFASIFKAAHGDFFVDLQIQLIQEHQTVLNLLPKFDAISRVTVILHPSNPRNSERWRLVDNRIKELNATSYKEEYIAKVGEGRKGLQAAGDSEIEAKIMMAQDGYGEARVAGTIDGKKRVVTTKTQPVSTVAPSDEVATPQEVVKAIDGPLKRILERFK
ncbi:MAG TPA: hypothetical protein VLB76_14500 [Thermoanaerobaculia bacterium]|jgi:hypothetical protein|nr:hypothetical protein [Thermoanaerobaculia bacterium]